MAPNSAKHTLYKSWKRAKTEEFDSLSKDSCLVRGMQSCPVDLVWRGLYHIYIYIYIWDAGLLISLRRKWYRGWLRNSQRIPSLVTWSTLHDVCLEPEEAEKHGPVLSNSTFPKTHTDRSKRPVPWDSTRTLPKDSYTAHHHTIS